MGLHLPSILLVPYYTLVTHFPYYILPYGSTLPMDVPTRGGNTRGDGTLGLGIHGDVPRYIPTSIPSNTLR